MLSVLIFKQLHKRILASPYYCFSNMDSGSSPMLWPVPITGLVTWTQVVVFVVALVVVVTHLGNAV